MKKIMISIMLLVLAVAPCFASVGINAGLANTDAGQLATIELTKNTPSLSMSVEYAAASEFFGQSGKFSRTGVSVFKMVPVTVGTIDKVSVGAGLGVFNTEGFDNGWSTGIYGVVKVDLGNYYLQAKLTDIRDSSAYDGWGVAIGKAF